MSYGYIRERVETEEQLPKPQVTSLADVTMALLVVFLTSATAALATIQVQLPHADHTAVRDTNLATTITVNKAGQCFFEDDQTPIVAKNLWTALKEIKGEHKWEVAIIRCDKETSLQTVNILVQCLQGLGVDEVCFQMDLEDQPK